MIPLLGRRRRFVDRVHPAACGWYHQTVIARLLLVLGMLAGAAWAGYRWAGSTAEPPPPTEQTVVHPGATVVVAVQQLSRLESTAYHVERVIDLQQTQTRFFGLVEAKDAILLVAAGDVTAGIDLSLLGERDVDVDHATKTVRIVLPRAQVFSTRIDNARTYVHTRDTDLLANQQLNLESKARAEAERTFHQAALQSGILLSAERSARKTVHALLSSLGFLTIEITFRDDLVPAHSR